jgi:hypothetical protein
MQCPPSTHTVTHTPVRSVCVVPLVMQPIILSILWGPPRTKLWRGHLRAWAYLAACFFVCDTHAFKEPIHGPSILLRASATQPVSRAPQVSGQRHLELFARIPVGRLGTSTGAPRACCGARVLWLWGVSVVAVGRECCGSARTHESVYTHGRRVGADGRSRAVSCAAAAAAAACSEAAQACSFPVSGQRVDAVGCCPPFPEPTLSTGQPGERWLNIHNVTARDIIQTRIMGPRLQLAAAKVRHLSRGTLPQCPSSPSLPPTTVPHYCRRCLCFCALERPIERAVVCVRWTRLCACGGEPLCACGGHGCVRAVGTAVWHGCGASSLQPA